MLKKLFGIFCRICPILLILLFSSCSVYKAGMEQAEDDPIPMKIPRLNYSFTYANVVGGNPQFVDNVVNSEVTKNIMKDSGAPVGNLEVRCDKMHLKSNLLFPILSGLTLFTGNLLGMPIMSGSVDIELTFQIRGSDGEIIKKYNYSDNGKYALSYYYGEDPSTKTLEICRNILSDFKKDVSSDYALLTQSLSAPVNLEGQPVDYELLADAVAQKMGGAGAESVSAKAKSGTGPVKKSDVDVNIPVTSRKAENTFVLIIANENYSFVDNVEFALHDGEVFKEYCVKTLGVPERQVWLYKDATAGIISGGVDKMVQAMSIFDNARAIVYYCGHGIPDENTGDAYIVPTDGKGTNTATCYSLNKLYRTLAESKATSVTYFLDACFTGANKEGSMLVAARGIAVKPKESVIGGNSVVFSAASGDETAMTFKEKSHGLFTYFLLKKLQETKGDVNYKDLADYIKKNVQKEAFLTNEKPQTPVIATSLETQSTWGTMTLN